MLIPTLVEIPEGAASPGLRARILAGNIVLPSRLPPATPRGRCPARVDVTGTLAVIPPERPGAVA